MRVTSWLAILSCGACHLTAGPPAPAQPPIREIPVEDFLSGDTAGVQFVVPSPDGRRLAFLTTQGTLYVWHLRPRQLLGKWLLPGPPEIHAHLGTPPIAFDDSGELLAIGTMDGRVRVWQSDPFQLLTTLVPTPPGTARGLRLRGPAAPPDSVTRTHPTTFTNWWPPLTLAFRLGTDQLAVGGADGLTLWDVRRGVLLDSLGLADSTGHFAPISKVAFEPSQGLMLAAGFDGGLHYIDPHTMAEDRFRDFQVSQPTLLLVTPRAAWLAIAGVQDSTVAVAPLFGNQATCRPSSRFASFASFSPYGSRLLVLDSQGALLIIPGSCQTLRLPQPPPYPLAGGWFDQACRGLFVVARRSRTIRWIPLPPLWECQPY